MPIYKKEHNNKTYEIITDEDISHLKLIIVRQVSGKLSPVVYDETTKKIALGKYLYGCMITHKNGNELDFRKKNVEKFSMAKYNLTKRRYESIYPKGIIKSKHGFTAWCFHNNNRHKVGVFGCLADAISERKKYQKKLGQIND